MIRNIHRSISATCTLQKLAKTSTFDKNFNSVISKRVKPWKSDSVDKDTWFKKKYAHIHVKEKQRQAHLNQIKRIKETKKQDRLDHKLKLKLDNDSKSRKYIQHGNINPLVEYMYGTNCVTAVLANTNRDKHDFYRLLIANQTILDKNEILSQLVKDLNVKVEISDKHNLNVLTKNGIHNGVVLETKPMDPMEITHLGVVSPNTTSFQIHRYQDEFSNNIAQAIQDEPYLLKPSQGKLYPLGIYLDEITDSHNLGAIIRTAFYLGVDFITISRRNCAQLSPVVSKCSSGAMECIPIYTVDKPLTFFDKSQQVGQWTFITSHINEPTKTKHPNSPQSIPMQDMHSMLEQGPVMLVVGNEGTGVRTNLLMKSNFTVQIPYNGPPQTQTNIDSLNVSVATAIMVHSLLSSM